MDAYIFAVAADSGAIADAIATVGTNARVALDATGSDRTLYVAVSGSNIPQLTSRVAAIIAISGIGGTETYIPSGLGSPPPFGFPTYAAVDAWVGLGIVVVDPSDIASVHAAIANITGVIGLALITGAGPVILVEVTASSQTGVNDMLDDVDAITEVIAMDRVVGERANGAGFTAI